LGEQAQNLGEDPEVRRVLKLWDSYCSRYEMPAQTLRQPVRQPVRRDAPRGPDVWPAAQR
jgi:hypothetical protein